MPRRHPSSPTFEALGSRRGVGDLANTGSGMKGGVFFRSVRVLLQEIVTTAEAVRMQRCRVDHRVALLLFGVLYNTCAPFPSPRTCCAVLQTQNP